MRILITTNQVPFVRGGAEHLAEGLTKALRSAGHEAEIVAIPFKWYPADIIPEQMLACQLLDLTSFCGVTIDLVIGLKFPAYLIPHPRKVYWILHQHRTAYELWNHPLGDLIRHAGGATVRDAIIRADTNIISQAKNVYTISKNVSKRLNKYCSIDSTPLYHPPSGADLFFCETAQDYLFFPSRMSVIKRQHLIIDALAETKENVMIKFAGTADIPDYLDELKQRAKEKRVEKRIHWLRVLSEEEKRQQYAQALGVIFPPIDEDYGYITLEAMLASKPVITCNDSGGPLEFITHRENGLIAEPSPQSLAAAMDELWQNRTLAEKWGKNGWSRYKNMQIGWPRVIESLLI